MLCPRLVFSPNCSVRQTHRLTATQSTVCTVPLCRCHSQCHFAVQEVSCLLLPFSACVVTFCNNVRQKNTGHQFDKPPVGEEAWCWDVFTYSLTAAAAATTTTTVPYRTVHYSRISTYVNSMFEISTFRVRQFTIIFRLP
jgi:hypothetical protein